MFNNRLFTHDGTTIGFTLPTKISKPLKEAFAKFIEQDGKMTLFICIFMDRYHPDVVAEEEFEEIWKSREAIVSNAKSDSDSLSTFFEKNGEPFSTFRRDHFDLRVTFINWILSNYDKRTNCLKNPR